ncbi:hypothetical protein [Microvirgula aerodenitrificans]|uniref:hypothetical protein n=1 Tax=Microvirgula aerodenitrificans TaxID=57480 RepID=UPI002F416035
MYANFPDLIKKSLFAINSIVFRTSAPAVFYPVTFPGKANFYGLDLPFDHFTPDDNLLVWKVMWPKTPGGSVSAAFQFSLYAQVGLLGAIILAFFTGVLLGGSWACVLKMDGSGPISLLLATLLLIFSIFLAIDSIRNSVVSSYGLIWAGLYLMLIMAASYARIRRNNTLGL